MGRSLDVDQFPDVVSLHPPRPVIGGRGQAFGVRGKLHSISLWLDLTHGQTRGTLYAGDFS